MFRRLALADSVTLAGLALGWTAVTLFLLGRFDAATMTLLLAFLCDKADGCLARRGYGSPIGHQLDALADVIIYLVPTAIVLFDLLEGAALLGSLAGTIVVGCGILRLARYATENGITTDGPAHYSGLTAFHIAAWALLVRLVVTSTPLSARLGAGAIVAVAPLMIASFPLAATRRQFVGAVVVGTVIAVGTLV